MKRRFLTFAALAALTATGALVALIHAPTASAAWDWHSLPAGYNVSSYQTCYDEQGHNHMPDCGQIPICNHLEIRSSAGTLTEADCADGFQGDLDNFINSTICTVNPGAGGQACAPTTTAVPPTTTVAPTTTQATTTAATATATTPPVQTVVGTTTVFVTTALTPVEQSLSDQVADLAAQIAALTTRVDRLEHAGDAASLAFEQALEGGATPADAAELARATWLNAVNGLGDFA